MSPDMPDVLEVRPDTPALVEGLRERKKRATRRALQLAALSLVAERGLDGVTTEEIAAAADVSSRTFFNYFPTKEDALVGADPELSTRLTGEFLARPRAESPLQALRVVFLTQAEAIADNQPLWQLRQQVVQANPSLLPALVGASVQTERHLAEAIAERTGSDPDDTYPALVAAVASAAMRTALQHCAATGFTRPLADVVTEIYDALMDGLPAPRH